MNKFQELSGNIKGTWKLLNSLTGKNVHEPPASSFNYNQASLTDPKDIADKFNDLFVNIGPNLASTIKAPNAKITDYITNSPPSSLALFPTTPYEIVSVASSLSNKTSAGIDEIPLNILKSSIIYISVPLSHLINSSIATGIFPKALKNAKICPIYKSGEKTDIANYRPISILSSFSKIYEKVIFTRLVTFCERNNIISQCQYGFRSNHSTCMALMDLYNKVSTSIENNEFAIGLFLDLSKAFDTLDHTVLLSKLSHYGIRGLCLEWFRSYLSEREQCVYYNGSQSSMKVANCGVPQGSILGPLLFILYMNDIGAVSLLLNPILFADDTNLFYSHKRIDTLNQIVNVELEKIAIWFRINKLSLNLVKTNFMLFGRKKIHNHNLQISIDGSAVEKVSSVKFLGVFIDDKLSWTVHTDHIAKKISMGLGIMNRVKRILPLPVLLTLYHTMIFPYLSYCNIVWGGDK